MLVRALMCQLFAFLARMPAARTRIPTATSLHTVNSPDSGSYPTCVTCTGFSGADMAGLLGAPTKLFIKLENPLFFLNTFPLSFASSLNLCRGLLIPKSPRGGAMSSIRLPVAAKLWERRTSGFARVMLLWLCGICDDCVGRAAVRSECWWSRYGSV